MKVKAWKVRADCAERSYKGTHPGVLARLSNVKMWFSVKPNLTCLQAAAHRSALSLPSHLQIQIPSLSPCRIWWLYSHVMNPISPVIQQKAHFMFINSLLPWKISILNYAFHDACPAQWRWQQSAAQVERGKGKEHEQPIQQQHTLHINFVAVWNCTQIPCICDALWCLETGSFTDSVFVIAV